MSEAPAFPPRPSGCSRNARSLRRSKSCADGDRLGGLEGIKRCAEKCPQGREELSWRAGASDTETGEKQPEDKPISPLCLVREWGKQRFLLIKITSGLGSKTRSFLNTPRSKT